MISAASLLLQAVESVRRTPLPGESEMRRAVSTAYYGLFHTILEASAAVVAPNDLVLQAQIRRSYNHGPMRKVCEDFWQCRTGRYPAPLDRLLPVPLDIRLIEFARTFVLLQETRHIADYDLTAQLAILFLVERVLLAEKAANDFAQIQNLPETRVFLTALLLADRWTRRA